VGKEAFRKQAKESLSYFSSRKQNHESIQHRETESEVAISFWAIAAMDLPNGIKKGQEIELKGKSIFRFSGKKISAIQDYA
jgi:hypothetical protein